MKSNQDIFSNETLGFVQKHINPSTKRVLEVGCGDGHFGLKLMQSGILLTACDTDKEAVLSAKKKGVPAIHTDFLSLKAEPFDAIIFTRSLHHIHQLKAAITYAKSLLTPGGTLIIEDFDLKMIDERTARWYYNTWAMVSICTNGKHPADLVEDPMSAWVHDHHHDHPLHTGAEMITAAKAHFDDVSFKRNAYLYRSICGRLDGVENSYEITKTVLDVENKLIQEQVILPNGLRVVAKM